MCHDALVYPEVSISWKHGDLSTLEFIYWDKNIFVFRLNNKVFEIRRVGIYYSVLIR